MNYEKLINREIFKSIDRAFFDLVQQSGDQAAMQAGIFGYIMRRKVSEYITEAVNGIQQSFKGGDAT